MKIYLLAWLSLLMAVSTMRGQQLPQYSFYMLNPYFYNPAYVGLAGTLLAHGTYRHQWVGMPGAPEGQYLDAHLPVYVLRGGVGARLSRDQIGVHQTLQAMLHYAYHLDIGRSGLFSVGVGAGYLQYLLDGAKLRTPEGEYGTGGSFTHNDPLFPEGKVTAGTPLLEAGVFFRWLQVDLGVAIQPVHAPLITVSAEGRFRLRAVPQYTGMGAYRIQLSDKWSATPSFLIKFDPAATQIEISSLFRWRENTFAGCSVRGIVPSARDALVLYGGFRITEKISFAYAYDLPLSSLTDAHRGSHELLLRYDLSKPIGEGRLPPIIYNPRFWGN
ncbi:MAG: type IX secretion system membrane protein PorP/SprF [Saprospiraceae bacterium]|nr:type IX secretion system membrane protein PorP/SprF [Saprospiraceae bacterium]MDW8484680.1 type IX secretion system membrane protein PorP/SprF [Saprospiraceae bacterium]